MIFGSALCALLMSASGPVYAQSLSGEVGEKKRAMVLPRGAKGHCVKVFKDYVAAPGHSAYASTRIGAEVVFCGSVRNADTTAEAERDAVKRCNEVTKRYKLRSVGPCEVVASK